MFIKEKKLYLHVIYLIVHIVVPLKKNNNGDFNYD